MSNKETKPTILVVEDNEMSRELLQEYLAPNYNVITASDGPEAMDIIEEKLDEIALVLLDIVMPTLNGFEMLEEMNENGWIASLPVVVVTGEGSEEFKNRAYLNNVYDFIYKPFTYEEIMKCVRRIVG